VFFSVRGAGIGRIVRGVRDVGIGF